MVDRRFKPIPPEQQLRAKRELAELFAKNPGQSLASSIKLARNTYRLTVDELAKISGISRRAILDIESGNGNPTLATLQKLLNVFGLSVGTVVRRANSASDP